MSIIRCKTPCCWTTHFWFLTHPSSFFFPISNHSSINLFLSCTYILSFYFVIVSKNPIMYCYVLDEIYSNIVHLWNYPICRLTRYKIQFYMRIYQFWNMYNLALCDDFNKNIFELVKNHLQLRCIDILWKDFPID